MSTLKLVDSIASSPGTRLDLNDGTHFSLLKNPDFSPPGLKRAVASTILRDGEAIPASAYNNRVVKLQLRVGPEASEDALATQLQLLERELDRTSNFLQWSSGTTSPVFFRTLRTPYESLDMEYGDHMAKLTIPVIAEPFAYGLRVTQSEVTVNHDPAAGSNGLYFDITGVTGNMATPLFLQNTGAQAIAARIHALAVRRHGTPANVTHFRQAEAMTQGVNTATQANDATYSGSGNNSSLVSFANSTNDKRLSGSVLGTAASLSADYVGTYRVIARVKKTVSGDTIKLQLRNVSGSTTINNDQVTLGTGTNIQMVDLGLLPVPTGPAATEIGYGGTVIQAVAATIEIWAQRSAGTGNLVIDYLAFIPADEELSFIKPNTAFSSFTWDGPNDAVYNMDGTLVAAISDSTFPQRSGTLPMLQPNQTNRIYFMRCASGDDSPVTATTTLTASFWPRFLYIRP